MFGKRRQAQPECNNAIRYQDLGATMSEEGEDIWQDLQEDYRAGGHKANSQNFH
jgi:hypothetical protein